MVFGRRGRKEDQEAAREAERRALFAELAKRPDTVCPFLGMADARTQYTDGVSDRHRCYAFGDPAELSSEQQTKVCLQRGYGNCPRYLRGVLVIPTEELEALRRPPPPIQPRPAAAAEPEKKRRGIPVAFVGVLGLILVVATIGAAAFYYLGNRVSSSAVSANLPAGTEMGAELISLSAPEGGSQRLEASAFIGETKATPDTTLVYVLDLSRTTRKASGCGGDENGDGLTDTVLDCEIASAAKLNGLAIENGLVGNVGLVGFAEGAVTADLGSADGDQVLMEPGTDDNGDEIPNVVEVMKSAFTARGRQDPVGFAAYSRTTTVSPTTVFSAGIEAACAAVAEADEPNLLVVFLSDGLNLEGPNVSDVLPCTKAAVFQTFAVGTEASCSHEPEVGGLATIAELTDGSCTAVPDLTQLPKILGAVVDPQIVRLQLQIDGAEPIDINQAASSSLPRPGPLSIDIDYAIPALTEGAHTLCLTVFGSDAGGPGSVKSCSPAKAAGGPLTSD